MREREGEWFEIKQEEEQRCYREEKEQRTQSVGGGGRRRVRKRKKGRDEGERTWRRKSKEGRSTVVGRGQIT